MKSSSPQKKTKKMQGPMKFVKTTSKRKSVSKIRKPKRESKYQISARVQKTIAESKKNNSKKVTKKVVKKSLVKNKPLVSTLLKGQERLEKHLAQSGLTSRREAKEIIKKGFVTVNGKKVREPGFGILPTDEIVIKKGIQEKKETILFYKPRGVETSKTDPDNIDIHDKFPRFAHLNPVGRLDKDTEGLILLSNDGVLTKLVTGEQSVVEKEYRVTVREDVFPVLLKKMENGIVLDGTPTKPCVTKKISNREYTITLTEGRKHQVRRMANACNLTITKLVRIRIGDFSIGKMLAGNSKPVTQAQIDALKNTSL